MAGTPTLGHPLSLPRPPSPADCLVSHESLHILPPKPFGSPASLPLLVPREGGLYVFAQNLLLPQPPPPVSRHVVGQHHLRACRAAFPWCS